MHIFRSFYSVIYISYNLFYFSSFKKYLCLSLIFFKLSSNSPVLSSALLNLLLNPYIDFSLLSGLSPVGDSTMRLVLTGPLLLGRPWTSSFTLSQLKTAGLESTITSREKGPQRPTYLSRILLALSLSLSSSLS